MDASAIAAAATANSQVQLQHEVSVEVLKRAIDIQAESAMQLLQAIPRPAAALGSTAGGVIDTWA